MNRRLAHGCLGAAWLLLGACSGSSLPGATGAGAHPFAASQPPARSAVVATQRSARPHPAALATISDTENDCVFLRNAARAIGEYEAFIARAGSDEAYARAVQRSREQMIDLEAESEFVRSGLQQRGAHCSADVALPAQPIALE